MHGTASSLLAYLLHPVSLFALLAPPAQSAHGMRGNLLLALAFAGARNCQAPLACCLAWLLFTLQHSLVQGACLSLPLLLWLARGVPQLQQRGDPCEWVRWEVALVALLVWCGCCSESLATRGAPAPLPALLQPHLLDPTSLAPELSLHWYLLSSAFLRALPYFSTLAWGLPVAMVPAIALRCSSGGGDPALGATLALALAALLDPSQGHTLLRLPLLTALALGARGGACAAAMAPRKSLLWGGLQAFSLLAAAPMKHLWLRNGAGNANFLFWQQLIFTLASACLLGEWARAALAAPLLLARPPAALPAAAAPADTHGGQKSKVD